MKTQDSWRRNPLEPSFLEAPRPWSSMEAWENFGREELLRVLKFLDLIVGLGFLMGGWVYNYLKSVYNTPQNSQNTPTLIGPF